MRRILTGTPVSNNILDVWHQFEILRKGSLGFQTYTGFKKEYAIVEKTGQFETVTGFNDEKIQKLKELMARLSFVVKKERCLDLPERLYNVVPVEMPDTVRQQYNEFAKEFYLQLEDGNEIKTEFILVQMLKLSQICCGYAVGMKQKAEQDPEAEELEYEKIISDIPNGSYKMDVMLDDAEEVCKSSKLIIWSRFRRSNQEMKKKLAMRGIEAAVFDGGTKEGDRQTIIDRFNNDDKLRVFIGNPQSGGVGLTLLGTKTAPCHTAYFYSNSFSFGSREQAEARNHRIGQINKVIYVDYVYKDSIEEYIADVLNGKRDLADEVKNVHNIKEMLLKVTANV
jgi:SNF2 family DNA or RNA helicase